MPAPTGALNGDTAGMGFVAAFKSAAQEALNRAGMRVAYFAPAGQTVRVRYAGATLHDAMARALAHNRIEPCEPELDVIIWDSATSGVALPPEVGRPYDHQPRGLGQLQQGPVRSLFDPDEGTLTMLDLASKEAVHWLPDAAQQTERERAAPLQTLLRWWLPSQGLTVVHAASVGTEDGAVVLLGDSGAGKSTTSLSCLEAGFAYIGDDLCALSLGAEVIAHSLYCSAKLYEHNVRRFPRFRELVINPIRLAETEKAIAYLDAWDGGVMRRSLPVRAIILLQGKGLPAPVINPLWPARALHTLMPKAYRDFPGQGKTELAGLTRVLARVPCFTMQLASDFALNAEALRELIAAKARAAQGWEA